MARKASEIVVFLEDAPLDQVVEVAEPPGDQPESSYTEQTVQDLTVYLDPDLASAIVVVAAWVTHCGCGLEKDEEDHGAPSYDIEAVYCD